MRTINLVGHRTLIFGVVSIVALITGFWLLSIEARGSNFAFLVAGIGALMTAIAGKSAVGSLSQGDGTKGLWENLTTSKKPGEPPAPPAPPAPPVAP